MSLKIDIIKKVLMLDTTKELEHVLDGVGKSISRELDEEEQDQAEFRKWKEKKESEESDEIRF